MFAKLSGLLGGGGAALAHVPKDPATAPTRLGSDSMWLFQEGVAKVGLAAAARAGRLSSRTNSCGGRVGLPGRRQTRVYLHDGGGFVECRPGASPDSWQYVLIAVFSLLRLTLVGASARGGSQLCPQDEDSAASKFSPFHRVS